MTAGTDHSLTTDHSHTAEYPQATAARPGTEQGTVDQAAAGAGGSRPGSIAQDAIAHAGPAQARAASPGAHPGTTGTAPDGTAPDGTALADMALAGSARAGAQETGPLAGLSVLDKVLLLTGADSWRTQGADALGLRPMITSDGPAGVRGMILDERHPSSSLPCPSALGATWDAGLVFEVAAALGAEARSKGVDVLLAPTINLMRTPLGGRGFECFAEDPVLTARLAVAYVRGVQQAGVAATIKHYLGNETETERWSYDARVDEHVLRELYLVPFEACVLEAAAYVVMAAYNKVNGAPMTEHGRLLKGVLKDEWGFDGVVTSDWHAARSTTATALATLDLSMPGPEGPWGDLLARAVQDGTVSEDVLDDKIIRLLRLARRVGALDGAASATPASGGAASRGARPTGRAGPEGGAAAAQGSVPALVDDQLLRRAVAASCVLLRNEDGLLPLDPAAVRRVAVLGPNAFWPTIQGGGSAGVSPVSVSTPVEAFCAALAGQADVIAAPGCQTWVAVPEAPAGSLRDPATGELGLRLEFRGADGTLLAAEHRASATLAWWDGVPPGVGWGEGGRIVLLASYRAATSGPHLFGASGVGGLSLAVDGVLVADQVTRTPDDPVEAMTRPGEVRAEVELAADRDVRVQLEFVPAADGAGPLAVRLGIVPAIDDDRLIAEAEQAAEFADVAVVAVGSAAMTESEGFDRATLALPGRQDDLVRAVARACPRTVVVVNSGMPMLMPWAAQVAAIVQAWLPGQAMGEALADVLLGAAEPGGRLPVTFPAAEADCPVLHAAPVDGVLRYDEGLLIGYRGYDRQGISPHFAFGHGLGYTTWEYESVHASAAEPGPGSQRRAGDMELTVTIRNTGRRAGKEVVQAYLAAAPGDQGRPVRVLAAFAAVTAEPGETADVRLRVPGRAFCRYDEARAAWLPVPGPFTLQVGRSSRDLRLSLIVAAP
jgi:beta-glucosidase